VPIKRLPGRDYSNLGAYFLTICTYRRRLTFVDRTLVVTVEACWDTIPEHHPADLDVFAVMPNHVHGILWLTRAGHARPLQRVCVTNSRRSVDTSSTTPPPGTRIWSTAGDERRDGAVVVGAGRARLTHAAASILPRSYAITSSRIPSSARVGPHPIAAAIFSSDGSRWNISSIAPCG
jgi:hypothetical protein